MKKQVPSVLVSKSEAGMQMVIDRKGDYAFFAETTFIQYYTHRNPDLVRVGEKLDSKEYGIGMPMSE